MTIVTIDSLPQSTIDVRAPIGSFLGASTSEWITAFVTIGITIVAAVVLELAFRRRGRHLAEATLEGDISPEIGTRLRFIQRLSIAAVIAIGLAFAFSHLAGVRSFADGILASGAIAAIVFGFAARQTLGNLVAGIMLALAQPLRVGDWITFEGHYGLVEDVHLTYTRLRTPNDRNVMIPNERLATGNLLNDTLNSKSIALEVDVWLPSHRNLDSAIESLQEETGGRVDVVKITNDGICLSVAGEQCPPPELVQAASDLRRACVRRLQTDGFLDS